MVAAVVGIIVGMEIMNWRWASVLTKNRAAYCQGVAGE